MEEKLYKIKKGNEFNFYSTEPSATINKTVGKSTQETRSGNNIAYVDLIEEITINGVTITPIANGTFKLNGTATKLSTIYIQSYNISNTKVITLKNGKTYYYRLFELGGTKTSSLIHELLGTNSFYLSISATDSINGKSIDMNTDSNMNGIRINIPNGATYTNYIFAVSIQADSNPIYYEQYGAMPSPEFPSPIINIGSNTNELNINDNWQNSGSTVYKADLDEDEIYTIKINNPNDSKTYKIKGSTHRYGYNNFDLILNANNNFTSSFTYKIHDSNKNAENGIIIWDDGTSTELSFAEVETLKIKIEKGSNSTGYTKYNCGGIDIDIVGDNLLNVNQELKIDIYKEIPIDLKSGTYTIKFTEAIKSSDNNISLITFRQDNTIIKQLFIDTDATKKSVFTIDKEVTNVRIYAHNTYNNSVGKTKIFKELMIYSGTTDMEYKPYRETTTTIELLEGVELCSLPNGTQDYVDGVGKIHKKVKEVVLDGTENWFLYNDDNENYISFYFTDLIPFKTFDIVCTHFKEIIYGDFTQNGIALNLNNGIYYLMITIEKNKLQTANVEGFKNYLSTQYENNTPVKFQYELKDENATQNISSEEFNKMKNMPVLVGENNLTAPSDITLLYYDERTEEEQIQPITITNSGKLLPFGLTVDFNKTDLPLIAEAIEATQTITGADGELVLDTIYGSRPFEIDAYTNDFLTPEEKEKKREEIRKFLNSIKKINTKLIIEPLNRTFEVKYAGLAEDTNLPKCVEFIIPLKSASSYAISNTKYTLNGEGEIESETEEPAGFICTILGQAEYPQLSLNGYSMSYDNVILDGEQLVIDTRKCTVTKINKVGTKTNAMAYYNHQFPKIQNGTNIVSIVSGIKNSNLKIEWNDLLL